MKQPIGEDGRPAATSEIDFDLVDEHVFGARPDVDLGMFSEEEIDRALTVLRVLLQWCWQDGMRNPQGLQIRASIMCWVFLKELRAMNLTELSTRFGQHKQSVARWVQQFKRAFPYIRSPHMHHAAPATERTTPPPL